MLRDKKNDIIIKVIKLMKTMVYDKKFDFNQLRHYTI